MRVRLPPHMSKVQGHPGVTGHPNRWFILIIGFAGRRRKPKLKCSWTMGFIFRRNVFVFVTSATFLNNKWRCIFPSSKKAHYFCQNVTTIGTIPKAEKNYAKAYNTKKNWVLCVLQIPATDTDVMHENSADVFEPKQKNRSVYRHILCFTLQNKSGVSIVMVVIPVCSDNLGAWSRAESRRALARLFYREKSTVINISSQRIFVRIRVFFEWQSLIATCPLHKHVAFTS